jgi:hypothetical protein
MCVLVTDEVHYHIHFAGPDEVIWDYLVSHKQILDSAVLQRWKERDV